MTATRNAVASGIKFVYAGSYVFNNSVNATINTKYLDLPYRHIAISASLEILETFAFSLCYAFIENNAAFLACISAVSNNGMCVSSC